MKFLIQNIAFLRLLRVKMLLVFLLVPITTFTAPHVIYNHACRHFDIRDGLAQMQVMSVFQDADGYMWFGTKNGLSKFDGNNFVSYKKVDGVPDGVIYSINQWKDDIVILTSTTISWFSPDHPVRTVKIPNSYIISLHDAFYKENKIFIFNVAPKNHTPSSENYLLIYDRKNNAFQFINMRKDEVRFVDDNYIITEKNIYNFNPDKNLITLSSIKLPQNGYKIIKNKNTQIYYLCESGVATLRFSLIYFIDIE